MLWLIVCADNKIGAEGAKAIGEALKTNETVTDVDLSRKKMIYLFVEMLCSSWK